MNSRITLVAVLLTGLAALITSCSKETENADPIVNSGSATPEPGSKVMTNTQTIGPGLQRLVDLAKQDLSKQLAIAEQKIILVEGKLVTWRDMSLGCPKPGMMYGQALVNGSLIKLEVGAKIYQYHSGSSREPFLCRHPAKNQPALPR